MCAALALRKAKLVNSRQGLQMDTVDICERGINGISRHPIGMTASCLASFLRRDRAVKRAPTASLEYGFLRPWSNHASVSRIESC